MTAAFEDLLQSASAATRNGQMEDARHLLSQAAALRPTSAIPHLLQAANFAQAGLNDLAEAAFVSCLARDPGLAIARFQLGLLQLVNSRAVTAQATWAPLLEMDDVECLKHFAWGFVHIVRGDRDLAERSMHRGIELNLENPSLNEDMLGVVERLARVESAPRAVATPTPESDDLTANDTTSAHFLISTYRQS
jgi:Flp pilus assembly protein TadD